jgi:uncharacterized membrane protein (UPF0182 family)
VAAFTDEDGVGTARAYCVSRNNPAVPFRTPRGGWANQQGSRVRRGSLIVIPIGRALLYAEAISCRRSAVRCPSCDLSCSRSRIG